jgi:parvulin-like peptidyl-prolyl isomerase
MQPGEMSGIIEVNGQYVILLLQGFTEPLVSDFEAVREELYKDLLETKLRKAMNQRLEGLMGNAQIDNFLTGTSQMGAAAMQASRRALQGR